MQSACQTKQLVEPGFQTGFLAAIKPDRPEAAFEVDFDDGLSFLEPLTVIRKVNRIFSNAKPVKVMLDEDRRAGFEVTYDTGDTAEVSWSFVRELPPEKPASR